MTISAKVIADSIGYSEFVPRITTLQLRYPRFIHNELMTHRVFSRNASSSRAIPVKRLIQDVIDDPVYPSYWGKNQKGMQADEECDNLVTLHRYDDKDFMVREYVKMREQAWDIARNQAIQAAKEFDEAGYHKQIVNRLLEPFSHINVVVTSTKWENFFHLRDHKDAQPEIRILAQKMIEAMDMSYPQALVQDEWHLPYITNDDWAGIRLTGMSEREMMELMIKVSVARCARVSYLTNEGKVSTLGEDLKLFERLLVSEPLHASPAEHQATPDIGYKPHHPMVSDRPLKWVHPELHGNFHGWIQFRKTIPGEYYQGEE